MKQYIKETRSYYHTFLFFMCGDLPFINNTQKTLKPSKKMFEFRGWMRKNFSRNMRCKLLQKRSTEKTTECSKHLRHIAIEKDIFSELNRCIFQISLNYIKLVIPKILFIQYYAVLIFTSKLRDPPTR